ncbi:MAG: hypothetical protein MAG795_01245 [Candidatus Woesearchaeota archaeon]|nr:hypothetical protein [Candidatus Woesearchaeota archaeon]
MGNPKVDQLAATLKSAGLAASVYDAKNMAQSITSGVETQQKDTEKKIEQTLGSGSRDEQPHPIFQPAKKQKTKQILKEPKEVVEKSFMQEKMETAEIFVNQDSLGSELEDNKPLAQVVEPEPEQPKLETQTALPESDSLSIFEEAKPKEHKQEQPQSETESKAEPEIQVETEQKTPVQVEEPKVKQQNVQPQPVKQEMAEKPKLAEQQTAPKEKLTRTDSVYEVEIDKSKPKATLTEEEKKATDITKLFNFANR